MREHTPNVVAGILACALVHMSPNPEAEEKRLREAARKFGPTQTGEEFLEAADQVAWAIEQRDSFERVLAGEDPALVGGA